MLTAYAQGVGTGAGLIIAIGAQNAFVLTQGIKKNHYLLVAGICALCDAVLVMAGVTGMGKLLATHQIIADAAGIGGAAFLFWYGSRAFQSAFKGSQMEADGDQKIIPLKAVVLTTLGVTLLNPHVYIDTVLLLGSIAGQFQSPGHLAFGAGAVTASFIWFFGLSMGATFLAPLFKKTLSWRILDTLVGIIMWTIAFSLVKTLSHLLA